MAVNGSKSDCIPANFFRVKCVRFSARHHERDFRKLNSHFRRFPEDIRTLPKMSEDVPTKWFPEPQIQMQNET